MGIDNQPLRCPHCRTPLTLASAVDDLPASTFRPEDPPPVAAVLAPYAGRTKDIRTARRGAARVRASLAAARTAKSGQFQPG